MSARARLTPMVLGGEVWGMHHHFLQHENHATPHLDLRWVTARSTNSSRLSPSHDFGKRVRIDSINLRKRVLPSRQCSVSSMGVALRSIGESGVGSSSADSHNRNRSASFSSRARRPRRRHRPPRRRASRVQTARVHRRRRSKRSETCARRSRSNRFLHHTDPRWLRRTASSLARASEENIS